MQLLTDAVLWSEWNKLRAHPLPLPQLRNNRLTIVHRRASNHAGYVVSEIERIVKLSDCSPGLSAKQEPKYLESIYAMNNRHHLWRNNFTLTPPDCFCAVLGLPAVGATGVCAHRSRSHITVITPEYFCTQPFLLP